MTEEIEHSNGKSNQQLQTFQLDEETKKALIKIGNEDSIQNDIDPTKHTLLNDAFVKSVDEDTVYHFTDYLDKDEVLQQVDLKMHAQLIPIVFGSMKGVPKEKQKARIDYLNKMSNLFIINMHEFAVQRMSFKHETKTGLIHAVRNDSQVTQIDKDVKKLMR